MLVRVSSIFFLSPFDNKQVVNDMDADMKELRRQLEEKTEQSARGRADHHSGATAAAAEEEEEEGLNAKLAEAEQKLIQKEVGYYKAQASVIRHFIVEVGSRSSFFVCVHMYVVIRCSLLLPPLYPHRTN